MLCVGITGSIGSGKTAVSSIFADLGVPVIDADVIARNLLEPGEECYNDTVQLLGKQILDQDKHIDRNKVRQIIFQDEAKRIALEHIIHPRVRHYIKNQILSLSADYCIVVIPLLFESNMQDLVDRILVIDTEKELCINRVATRDQCTTEEASRILNVQTDNSFRLAAANDVLTNNGNLEQLVTAVKAWDQKYRTLGNRPD